MLSGAKTGVTIEFLKKDKKYTLQKQNQDGF